jgi:hypothetical protein
VERVELAVLGPYGTDAHLFVEPLYSSLLTHVDRARGSFMRRSC